MYDEKGPWYFSDIIDLEYKYYGPLILAEIPTGPGKWASLGRNAAQKGKFLKQLFQSRKLPKWMNQWLKKGKVPPGYNVDHVKPISIGGPDVPSNMRLQNIDMHRMHHRYYRPWSN